MKKTKISLSKKLNLHKETITLLGDMAGNAVGGIADGISGKICPPVSGTGCGCAMQTCGIVICQTGDCASAGGGKQLCAEF